MRPGGGGSGFERRFGGHGEPERRFHRALEVTAFHQKLCETRVLDPACGSGNFLYVTLEHMKRLEGEVIDLLRELGEEGAPASGTEIARGFKSARADRVDEVLAALAALGQARHTADGRYAA